MTRLGFALLTFFSWLVTGIFGGYELQAAPISGTFPQQVYVGVHLIDVTKITVRDGTFDAAFFLWLRWAGDQRKTPNIQIVNGDTSTFSEVMRESRDGWNSVRWRVQGTFRERFSVADFPFERHPIEIKLRLDKAEGALLPDLAASSAEPSFSATGWTYEPYFEERQSSGRIAGDLGSVAEEGQARETTDISFVLTLERPWLAVALRYLPLLIVIIVPAIALLAPSHRLEITANIIVTSLLAAIAFYFVEAGTMPDVPYMTRAQGAFLGAYCLILAALVIAYVNFFTRHNERPPVWLGQVGFAGILLLTGIGTAWFLRPLSPTDDTPYAEPVKTVRPTTFRSDVVVELSLGAKLPYTIYADVLRRGISRYNAEGAIEPHLLVKLPSISNDFVHFLPDGKMRVIWRLKPGLKWGDGTPIVAEDVLLGQRLDHGNKPDLKILDELTVESTYPDRDRHYLAPFPILPHQIFDPIYASGGWKAVLERLRTSPPPLDGPYILQRFTPEKEAILVRNPYYEGPRPILENVHFVNFGTTEKYLGDLKEGAADLGPANTELTFRKFEGTNLVRERFKRPNFYTLQFDLSTAPFNSAKVRRAIGLAINRAALSNSGTTPASYTLPGAPDYVSEPATLPYDPAEARRLLAEAGVVNGFELKLYVYKARLGSEGETDIIERVEADLRNVGFDVKRTVFDSGTIGRNYGGVYFTSATLSDDAEVGALWGLTSEEGTDEQQAIYMAKNFGPDVAEAWRVFNSSPYDPRKIIASQRLQNLFSEKLPTLLLSAEEMRTVRNPALEGWHPDVCGPSRPFWNIEHWRFVDPPKSADASKRGIQQP